MRPVYLLLAVLLLGTCPGCAQESQRYDRTPSAAKLGADEQAIADLVAAFAKAFNGGDAAAAAATFAEDALVVDEHGGRTEGRAAIRAQLAASFAGNSGSTIAIKVDSLRFLGPDTALEEGQHDDHAGRIGWRARDHSLHGRLRQERRPMAPIRRPRRACP